MFIDTNKKLAGILVPAFALRSKDDLGIGDTKAVKEAIDFCHQYSLGVLQLLPINETGGDNSPYNAISAMALDPVLSHISASALDIDSSQGASDYLQVKSKKNFLLQKACAQYRSGQV